MNRNLRTFVAALLMLPLVLAAGLAPAQAGSTQTGTIRGKVVDEKGEALPGVTILVRSEALVRERATVTDIEGNYFVAGLPAGKYTVVTQLSGYLTIAQDTAVSVDKTTTLATTAMKPGELQETVTVTADKPIIDKTTSEKATLIEREFTDKLPAGRSYQSLIQYAPGVTGGANPNILGGTSNSNVYLVDGVNSRDPVTGTFGLNLNFDAVEDVDIKLTGISAEYGQHSGGVINTTTKTGGNEWSGSLRDVINAPSWTNLYNTKSQDEFRPAEPGLYTRPGIPGRTASQDNKTNRISATLGGPVVQDNAWFFLAYDRVDAIAATPLGNPSGGVLGDGNFGNFFDGNFSLGKLTWQVTNNHRLQYQYSEDPAQTTRCYGQIFFGGPCYDTEAVDNQGQGGYQWVGNWNATWGPNVVSDVKVTKFKNGFHITPLAPIPFRPNLPLSTASGENGPSVDVVATGTTFDANIFSQDPEQREREQYEGSVTWFFDTNSLGTHTMKFGADYWKTHQLGSSIIQGNELLFFAFADNDLDGFADNPPPGLGGTGNAYDETNRSYLLWYDYAPPGSGGPTNKYTALYINDTWQLNDYLTLNLGIRGEKSDNQNDQGEKIIDDTGIAPRLGVNWDITGQGKYVLSGTAARYLAGVNVTTISPFVRAAGGQSSYDIYFNLDYPFGAAPGAQPNWALIGQVRPDPDTATFDDDLVPQSIDEGALAFDWAVTPTFGIGVQGVYRKWNDIITSKNSFDYSTGVPRKITLFVNNDDTERDYKAGIIRVEKRLADNWMLMGNYTYSIAEGNIASDQGFDTFGNYDDVPNSTENKNGELNWDSTHNVKLQAFYNVPLRTTRHGLSFGMIYDYRSGFPYAGNASRSTVVGPGADGVQDNPLGTLGSGIANDQVDNVTTFFEERGTHRAPHLQNVDLSGVYKFNFAKDVFFETRLEVFNVLNEQHANAVNAGFSGATGTPTTTFGYPTSYSQIQIPRGFRVQFAFLW